ncbi:MAG: CHASE2 domain-containing protein [candidate division Zixibacteria bacterium]|nr:CHASE2 domain-containing protein [candidate division Zixibacteria bacterium]
MLKKSSGLILYLLITLFIITIYLDQPRMFQSIETAIFDKLFELRGKKQIPDDIQIVAIDDASLKELGPWPWHRGKLATLIEKLSEQQPKVILLNLALPEDAREDSLGYTQLLANKIKEAGNVILPYRYSTSEFGSTAAGIPEYLTRHAFVKFDDKQQLQARPPVIAGSIYLPSKALAEAAYGLGFSGINFDFDRHVRSQPMILSYAGGCLPSVDILTAYRYYGYSRDNAFVEIGKGIKLGALALPTDHAGRMPINFNGPAGLFKYVSAADVMMGATGRKDLTGKIAIVAYTGSGSSDFYTTPVSKMMPGVEITANAIENIIHGNFLREVGAASLITIVFMLGIGIFAAFILPKISMMYRLVSLGILLFVMANVGFALFAAADIMTKISYPIMMIVFFMITSPMLKPQKDDGGEDSADDDVEIDYDKLLSSTPIGGINMAGTAGTSKSDFNATKVTMPLNTQSGSSGIIPIPNSSGGSPVESGNFGRYRIIEPIGRGAMGMVYRGMDPAIDRPVALKTIRVDNIAEPSEAMELRERLTREAKAAGKLSHPNIVTIYDVGEQNSLQYIAMEYLDGQTLEALLHSGHRWDYKTICKIMIQVCEALDFAHEHGIVHRDIKPANIMVVENDKVKVMDFGIARFDSSNMTQSGVALGTPNYISPEQLKGQPVDRRSDIFSLGVVFYELLTGEKPFKGDTISALIYSILHTSPPPPSEINLEVPRIFDKIIAKALVKDPDMRFQTSREMADILRKLI